MKLGLTTLVMWLRSLSLIILSCYYTAFSEEPFFKSSENFANFDENSIMCYPKSQENPSSSDKLDMLVNCVFS